MPVANPASGNRLRPTPYGGPRAERPSDPSTRSVAGGSTTARSAIAAPHFEHAKPFTPNTRQSSALQDRHRDCPRARFDSRFPTLPPGRARENQLPPSRPPGPGPLHGGRVAVGVPSPSRPAGRPSMLPWLLLPRSYAGAPVLRPTREERATFAAILQQELAFDESYDAFVETAPAPMDPDALTG